MSRLRTAAAAAAIVALGLLPATAAATFPGKNGWLYISAHEPLVGVPDIFRVRPDGTGLKLLTDGQNGRPTDGSDPSISANAKRLAITTGSQGTSDVWVMSGEGKNPERLTDPIADPECQIAGLDQMPAISPNGKRIAFMTTRTTPCDQLWRYDIWTMNADGSNPQPLLHENNEDYYPDFAPNGSSVFMSSEISGGLDIARVTLAGAPHTAATHVTTTPGVAERVPSVHPSGNRVAFARGNPSDILEINVNGTNEEPLTADAESQGSPAYSPDGKKIAWAEFDKLVIARADGSNPKTVPLPASRIQFVNQVDWASDTIRPRTRITKGPKGETAKDTAKFGFRSSEPASTFKCKLDSKPYKRCEPGVTYKNLKRGEHEFRVRATDFAGNRGKPAKYAFRVLR